MTDNTTNQTKTKPEATDSTALSAKESRETVRRAGEAVCASAAATEASMTTAKPAVRSMELDIAWGERGDPDG